MAVDARTNKVTHDQLAENIQNELQRKMVGIYLNQNTLTVKMQLKQSQLEGYAIFVAR
jgi:hypothetical protein